MGGGAACDAEADTGREGEAAQSAPAGETTDTTPIHTETRAQLSFSYFRLDVERQKLLLRRLVLYTFSFWLLLGLLLWWWATEIPRAPVPLLQSYFFAARTHAASRVSPAAAAFPPAAATASAAAQAAAAEGDADTAAGTAAAAAAAGGEAAAAAEAVAAEAAAAAAATLAASALHRGPSSAVRPPSLQQHKTSRGYDPSLPSAATAAGSNSSNAAAVSSSANTTPHPHAESTTVQREEEEQERSVVASSSLLLPPLSLVFGLRLLPLCEAAAEDARLFYRLLLSRTSAAKYPLHRSLFSVDEGNSLKNQQQQEAREEGGEGPVTSVEAAFTAALDVVFGGSTAVHTDGEEAAAEINRAEGKAAKAAAAAAAEARQRLLLQQSASLALLRVELLRPLSSACAPAGSSADATDALPAFSSSAAGFPRSWSAAAAAVALESEAALAYTVAFSAAAPLQREQQANAVAPGEQQRKAVLRQQQEEERREEHNRGTELELHLPEIILHGDSAATVYSLVASDSLPSSAAATAASASHAAAAAAPASSFALQEGAAALFHLLQVTVFRRHAHPAAAAADAVTPGQYELSFWLAGDPPPRSAVPPLQQQQQKQQQTQAQRQRQEEQRQLLPQTREWTRLRWNFERDVLHPYLLPFFSRAALLFTFPSIQSQVVPLSGIASLLKKATSIFPRLGAESGPTLPPPSLIIGGAPPGAAAAAADSLYVLDVASQHRLHAVSSRWQPQQIVSAPTYFPAPLLNFVYYKPPVPAIILQEMHATPTAAAAGTQKVLLATYGVSIPSWGALVIGPPPAAAFSASAACVSSPSDADQLSTASPTAPSAAGHAPPGAAAVAGASSTAAASPSVAASPAADGGLSEDELRYASSMWIAQLRSIFLLPSTLQDYFYSSSDAFAAATASAAAGRQERAGGEGALQAQEGTQEEEQVDVSAAMLLGEGWQVKLVSDGAGSLDSSSSGGTLVLRMLQRQAPSSKWEHANLQAAAEAAAARREEAADAVRGKGGAGAARRRNVRVVVEAAVAGLGMWEVWGVARQVYVQFILQALKNIHRLQSIIVRQPELVVLPHIGEALKRALVLIECSAEAAVLHRICTQLPPSLKRKLLEPTISPDVADSAAVDGLPGELTGEQRQKSTRTISNARFFFFALALARAALQDSLEVLYDESVEAESHFGIEFKCAIYLPFSVPFLIPVLVGLLKLHKQSKKLSKFAQLTRSG